MTPFVPANRIQLSHSLTVEKMRLAETVSGEAAGRGDKAYKIPTYTCIHPPNTTKSLPGDGSDPPITMVHMT